jgi:hypothetical protein
MVTKAFFRTKLRVSFYRLRDFVMKNCCGEGETAEDGNGGGS